MYINYPPTTLGTATRRGRSLNNDLANPQVSGFQVLSGQLRSQPNDAGGNNIYVFNLGTAVFNHRNGANLSNLNPIGLNAGTQFTGSLVQTTNIANVFDQCNGYRITLMVQYNITRTVNRLKLVPRAPN